MILKIGLCLFCFQMITAEAFPNVGDEVVLKLFSSQSGVTIQKQTVLEVDLVNQRFKYQEKIEKDNSVHVQVIVDDISSYSVLIHSVDSLTNCQALVTPGAHASSEIKELLILGKMQRACHLHQILGSDTHQMIDVWFGKVPFGMMKEKISSDDPNQSTEVEMLGYTGIP